MGTLEYCKQSLQLIPRLQYCLTARLLSGSQYRSASRLIAVNHGQSRFKIFPNPSQAATRSAGFLACCIADFPVSKSSVSAGALQVLQPAGSPNFIRQSADLSRESVNPWRRQTPNPKRYCTRVLLEIGSRSFSGSWCLEFIAAAFT